MRAPNLWRIPPTSPVHPHTHTHTHTHLKVRLTSWLCRNSSRPLYMCCTSISSHSSNLFFCFFLATQVNPWGCCHCKLSQKKVNSFWDMWQTNREMITISHFKDSHSPRTPHRSCFWRLSTLGHFNRPVNEGKGRWTEPRSVGDHPKPPPPLREPKCFLAAPVGTPLTSKFKNPTVASWLFSFFFKFTDSDGRQPSPSAGYFASAPGDKLFLTPCRRGGWRVEPHV